MNVQDLGGIRTRVPSKQAAEDPPSTAQSPESASQMSTKQYQSVGQSPVLRAIREISSANQHVPYVTTNSKVHSYHF
jgi:hypothetical protein